MMNRSYTLLAAKQFKALGISRGSVYSRPKPVSEYDQGLMTCLDRWHAECSFGCLVCRVICCSKMTQRHPAWQVYFYLFRYPVITWVNHVCAVDSNSASRRGGSH